MSEHRRCQNLLSLREGPDKSLVMKALVPKPGNPNDGLLLLNLGVLMSRAYWPTVLSTFFFITWEKCSPTSLTYVWTLLKQHCRDLAIIGQSFWFIKAEISVILLDLLKDFRGTFKMESSFRSEMSKHFCRKLVGILKIKIFSAFANGPTKH